MSSALGAKVGQFDIKRTEWPAHSAMFYLLATEALQKAWDNDHSLSKVAPNVYARDSIDAAAALLMDPGNATWVRNFWGDDKYLQSQDVFFRMMVINGLTAHLALTGDKRYAEFLRAQADSLAAELDASPHGLLDDYPGQCYPVDIVPAIAGIQRIDRLLGTGHSEMIARAERLMEGPVIDAATGLPGYFVDKDSGFPLQPARGIGMSMSLVWTPQLWPAQSRDWYALYVKQFWQQDAMLAGFREFRKGSHQPEWQDEVDAGPVIAGYGTSASAFGLAAATVNGDHPRARLLALQAITSAWPLPNGALPGARVLSTPDAPYTGVTALLFALTRQKDALQPASSSWADFLRDREGKNGKLSEPGGAPDLKGEGASFADIPPIPPAPVAIPAPVSERTPGFVFLFIGGGLAIGLLMLYAVMRRFMKPRREMGPVGFGIWAALMLAGAGLWFINPWWSAMAWLASQWWPRGRRRARRENQPALSSQRVA